MSPDLNIREADLNDIDAILRLKKKSMGPVWKESGIYYDESSLKKFLQKRLVDDRMIVASGSEGEGLLGFLHSRTFKGVVTSKKIREVMTLAVHPDHFGEGIGKELMEHEKEHAKSSGVDILRLETLADNERALNFYRSQGFSERKKILINKIDSEQE